MSADLKKIADFFLENLITQSKYNSVSPNSDQSLLFPGFLLAVKACIARYNKAHSGQDVTFTETYRGNPLQLKYFNRGASKIKENGMHHYGIAADCVFLIGGKQTYKGDVMGLRKVYKENGLFILGMWDSMHVQFVAVNQQKALRDAVKDRLIAFQKASGLKQTGEADAATIAAAKEKFP